MFGVSGLRPDRPSQGISVKRPTIDHPRNVRLFRTDGWEAAAQSFSHQKLGINLKYIPNLIIYECCSSLVCPPDNAGPLLLVCDERYVQRPHFGTIFGQPAR